MACINAAARRLFVGLLAGKDQPNLLRYIFTSPQARALLPDWETRCQCVLAEFRRDYGRVLGDLRVASVVAWLLRYKSSHHYSKAVAVASCRKLRLTQLAR